MACWIPKPFTYCEYTECAIWEMCKNSEKKSKELSDWEYKTYILNHNKNPYPITGTSPSVIEHCNKGD